MIARKRVLHLLSMLGIGFMSSQLSASPRVVNPGDYPQLSPKQLGQVRYLVKLAHNLPGDWSGYGSQFLATERTRQFQISFGSMALGLAQHQYTPAYRALYREAIEDNIKKLQHPDVWERWLFTSRGGARGGLRKDMGPGWMDPIAKDNIMLKAYVFQLGALHEMLYGGKKYDRPDAFTFFYQGNGMGNGLIKFKYSLGDIAKIINNEIIASNYIGVACEPGRIFWSCNAPSGVGFMHYDHVHGTEYSNILKKMKNQWVEKGFIDPKNHRYGVVVSTSWADRSAEQRSFPLMSMVGDTGGWSAMFNNAWDRQFVRDAYYANNGKDRNDTLNFYLSGAYAKMPAPPGNEGGALHSVLWGYFLNYAAEVGDKEAVAKMLAYADRNYHPVWQNGEYYYPRNDDYSVDKEGNSSGIDPWAATLIAVARLNKGDGFSKLYNEPWGDVQYRQPYIDDINDRTTGVSQAFYDDKKDALVVTLVPGPITAKTAQFAVRQLDPKKTYTLTKDGKTVGQISGKTRVGLGSATWRTDGSVLVSTDISKAHTFILQGAS